MSRIRRALVSVHDKTGLVPFVRGLRRLGVEILSTGGTARFLRKARLPVTEVSEVTGFPEILGGRVKTLHPKLLGGILADRSDPRHRSEARRLKIPAVDLVVVNLYPFEERAARRSASLRALVQEMDIGGVTLLRAAAKNFEAVGVVCRPSQYPAVLEELGRGRGYLSSATRLRLASEAFGETAYYDTLIHQVLAHRGAGPGGPSEDGEAAHRWPQLLVLGARRRQVLRYGENPHQPGAWYAWPAAAGGREGLAGARQLHGKELSFNNLLDLDAASQIAFAFERPCAVVVKHGGPCGAACAVTLAEAFRRAHACDPTSAFGGIVGFNRRVDAATVQAILESGFLECVAAPRYERGALRILKQRKNLRILEMPPAGSRAARCVEFRQVSGGLLLQRPDRFETAPARWRRVAGPKPPPDQMRDLVFAWRIARFVRSNAIVIAQDEQTVGIAGGLPSRVDSVRFALEKAGLRARGGCLASDGFFPKPDGPELAVRAGVAAIAQPGGSVQDPAVIEVAARAGIPMFLTGERHFRH